MADKSDAGTNIEDGLFDDFMYLFDTPDFTLPDLALDPVANLELKTDTLDATTLDSTSPPSTNANVKASTPEEQTGVSEQQSGTKRKRRRNLSRERQQNELKRLRSLATELETQLSALEKRQQALLRPGTRAAALSSADAMSGYQQLALGQWEERRKAEQTNAQLKATVAFQHELQSQIQKLMLQSQTSAYDLPQMSDTKERGQEPLQMKREDAMEFAKLERDVEKCTAQVYRIFHADGKPMAFHQSHVKEESGVLYEKSTCQCTPPSDIDFTDARNVAMHLCNCANRFTRHRLGSPDATQLIRRLAKDVDDNEVTEMADFQSVPFSIESTTKAVWRSIVANLYDGNRVIYHPMTRLEDRIAVKYQSRRRKNLLGVEYMLMQKLVQADGVMIVWSCQQLGAMSSKVRVKDRGWVMLTPSERDGLVETRIGIINRTISQNGEAEDQACADAAIKCFEEDVDVITRSVQNMLLEECMLPHP